ncbi:DNA (cytosine-5-)-methyltransferase [Enterovibrio norvegicus]|uniref:DNA cytosine methyltransferase n=1 Tax=Enterovibrio norvegicus TaxID=188144 RepID=UPI0002E11CB9|nr:DNA cytosine methyltransferase [Enterovibrio norvegicus]OEF51873.1 DNA (cytosine-5-)-methyltransferase [Enterovibrio norvegicus]
MKFGLSAVSLFSGAGGMDVGFEQAGFNVLFANDIDEAACQSYNLNHSIKSHCGDLRSFTDEISKFKGVDVVFGGPPCQGFSVAGKMDPDDERSQLLWSYLDTVELLQPKAFICENVKALAVNSRWSNVRERFFDKAASLGYKTAMLVLNAADYGVPQARERMFIVGLKSDDSSISNNSLLNDLSIELANQQNSPESIADLIRRLGPAGSEGNSKVCSAVITYAKKPVLRKSPYAGMLFNGAGRPINSFGIALTLPASMGGNKTPIVDEDEIFNGKDSYVAGYHKSLMQGTPPKQGYAPDCLRRITVDEALAIQTFPSNYKLAGSQSAMFRQIGNAVPCELARVVAVSLSSVMNKHSGSLAAA